MSDDVSDKERLQHREPHPLLFSNSVGPLMSHRVVYEQGLWDGTSGLLSLSEKTWKSNHLQMSLQRQNFLLSYFKTLSVGPAGIQTHDLPLSGKAGLHVTWAPIK